MANGVRTSRTRGSLCGLLLVVFGGWAGIAPFIGPGISFGYTPNETWTSTQGRVYLSAVPAAVTVLAGLILIGTRSRGFGGFCATIAALAGGWLIVGSAAVRLLPASVSGSIGTGAVLGVGAHRAILTPLAFFAGPGALIVFTAALAIGRLSITAYRDYLRWPPVEEVGGGLAGIGLGGSGGDAGYGGYADPSAPTQDLYGQPSPEAAPTYPQDSYRGAFGLTEDYPAQRRYQYPRSQPPFPPAEDPSAPSASTAPAATTEQQTYPQQSAQQPDQAHGQTTAPGPIGPGVRLERQYPPSGQVGQP